MKEIEKHGIVYKQLQPVNLSQKGDYYVAVERVSDLKTKAKGIVRILRVFYFEGGKISRVDSIPIPIIALSNITLNDRKNEVLVVGNHGTKVIRIDLEKKTTKTLFEHRKGRSGFKCGAFLVCHQGKYYATGWSYDKEQYWLGDYLTQLKIGRKRLRFSNKVNLHKLYKEDYKGLVTNFYYISGDYFYFNIINEEEGYSALMQYRKNKVVEVVRSNNLITLFVGTPHKVFYIVEQQNKTYKYFVKDLKTKKVQPVKMFDGVRLTYPFLRDNVLVAINLDLSSHSFNAFYGLKKNKYQLTRFLRNQSLGPMKISGDGTTYILMNIKGFTLGKF